MQYNHSFSDWCIGSGRTYTDTNVDAIPITAAQIGMIIKIGDLFDISLSEAAAKSIAGVALTQQAGRSVASGLLKMIPELAR